MGGWVGGWVGGLTVPAHVVEKMEGSELGGGAKGKNLHHCVGSSRREPVVVHEEVGEVFLVFEDGTAGVDPFLPQGIVACRVGGWVGWNELLEAMAWVDGWVGGWVGGRQKTYLRSMERS